MIKRQAIIKRSDARNNPGTLYLFSDDCERSHEAGHARELRGEDNAVGIRVKWNRRTDFQSFFRDKDAEEIVMMLEEDFDPVFTHLGNNGDVVIPDSGIGTGIGKLEEKAPRVWLHLCQILERLHAA
jgi:hypothetical protein